ncbi:uncharacterized protein LOC127005358 isoform X3 [Eriocheir sinensis]|uniref:uncharacterized protein LOC127005358 isoform X3 n=1 Tax=Eriocheir sinensis TaxID=95602 RepID=UPI0021C5FBB0|nr:uncharacterized protein LOC127005358 isoform X3 [Eriocheir sinensis]
MEEDEEKWRPWRRGGGGGSRRIGSSRRRIGEEGGMEGEEEDDGELGGGGGRLHRRQLIQERRTIGGRRLGERLEEEEESVKSTGRLVRRLGRLGGGGGGRWGLFQYLLLLLHLLPFLVGALGGAEAVTTEPQRVKSFLEYSDVSPSTVPPCLDPGEGNPDIKAQHIYVNEKEQPLTMMTSHHVPHQLMTRIVAIFLKEWLGYVNLTIITVPESFDPGAVVENMMPKKEEWNVRYGSKTSIEVQIPQAMVNLKVWVPPGYNLEPLTTEFDTSSYLGTGGRFGWFLPAKLLDYNDFILEHWRSFITKDSLTLKIFHRTPQELQTLSNKVRDPGTDEFYCPSDLKPELQCQGGIFSPPWCQSSSAVCAVLFTSRAELEIATFLHQQILTMKAFVRVAYIGPHLDHNFLRANMMFPKYQGILRSVLVFHWWPSVLLQPFNFTSVSFQPCIDSSQFADAAAAFQCKYEMHPFHKFVWKKLVRYAKFAYEALHMVQINNIQFSEILNIYNTMEDHGPNTLDKVACTWMKRNKDHWRHWHSGHILHELRLVGLFPMNSTETERFKFVAPGNVPAYFMAVDAINANNSILKDYHIRTIVLNGACNSAIVMRKFIEILQRSSSQGFYNNMIGFVGPACSDTIEPIAGVSKYFNIPIISYGAEGAIFSGQDDYPYFFRTIPENKIFGHVYKHLFRSMEWRRIASLVEEGHRYSEYLTVLEEMLQEHNMTLDKKEFSDERKTSDVTTKLQTLRKDKFRIIIGDFYQDVASEVLCGAYHLQMTGREGYLWFLPHWFSKDWYSSDSKDASSNCSTEEMKQALEGHMSLSYKYFAESSDIMQTGQNISSWRVEYGKKIKEINFSVPASDYAGFTYDAVWVYALALDQLFKEDPSYSADLRATNTTQAFMKKISGLSFNGVSGHINFTSDSTHGIETRNSRLTDIIVWQFQSGKYVQIASYHPRPSLADEGELTIFKDKIIWPSGAKPDDGSEKCVVEGFRNFLNLTCTQAVVVLCTICFSGLTLILLVCFFIFKRRYEKKLEQMQEFWRGRPLLEIFDGWEIPRDKVVINRKLGEGAFGTVYGGECLFDSQGWVAVAVKTLKLGSTISEKLDFLSEAEMMKNFEHENIVHLLGVCTKTEPIYTVMEFMLYGDLKTYLLARRNLVNEKSRSDDDEVSNKRLTSMALDIARGLAYLAQMKYVHRDVACRNCLVNANRMVKLADFGMTRPMYENNYYKFHRKGMLPVRWMAPESLTEGVFTTMSDIWSYGVLLYEIVTFGAFPFQGMTNDQVLEHVKAGHTIAIPRGVKTQLEVLLRMCWQRTPSRRPPIQHIIEHLTNHPRLISPCLDGPQSSVQIEDTRSLEMMIPDKTRKSSLSINHRLQNMASSSSRKRSMSGNMNVPPLTTSLSEDGMIAAAHSNLDALNLNHVMLEEGEPGEDPLLPPGQYMSSRYVSLAHKEQPHCKERESLVGGPEGDYCTTDISRDLWTSVTPV